MDRISTFISYSSNEKEIAGKFKQYLIRYCGFEVFVAHEDIQPSSEWEDEIMKSLKRADCFIPLLSEAFKRSDYTGQEVGAAICLNKRILPIKLTRVNPYGFMRKYHAMQYKSQNYGAVTRDNIIEIVMQVALVFQYYDDEDLSRRAVNSIALALLNSRSFDTSNTIIKIICNLKFLDKEQIDIVMKAIKINSQVRSAFGLKDLISLLVAKYRIAKEDVV